MMMDEKLRDNQALQELGFKKITRNELKRRPTFVLSQTHAESRPFPGSGRWQNWIEVR